MSTEIIALSMHAAGEPTQPAADRLVEGDPRQSVANAFSDPTGQFHVGYWRSSAGAWRVRYTEHELCHLLAGRLRIRSDRGDTLEFAAGASFVVPAGFSGVWEVLEPVTKLYAIFEHA